MYLFHHVHTYRHQTCISVCVCVCAMKLSKVEVNKLSLANSILGAYIIRRINAMEVARRRVASRLDAIFFFALAVNAAPLAYLQNNDP